ncbi:DUF1934 domain-containing protein [Clostridium tarantellae]|uniref:DUF1934 family protein n=1 Tax=Clostridium tarantellae TaxID=39493 RepID=A0A6I1MHX8_9CLOT|nr:DUF1934 domain-containing protein [Clostridium tarantellae]MPQ43015.1 DUF1934 family protein [Clostridium tarantellae]
MNKKKAIISVSSIQMSGSEEKIEVVSVGEFYKTDDGYKAIYEESEISGMEGTTTKLDIKENSIILNREGTTSTTMEFKNNKDAIVLYNTPYGMLELKTITKKVDIDINEDGGKIDLEYLMIVANQEPLNTNLSIDIKVHK